MTAKRVIIPFLVLALIALTLLSGCDDEEKTTEPEMVVIYDYQITSDSLSIDKNLKDVFFVDSLHGWAVGVEGTIIHTHAAAAIWTAQTSGTSDDLHSVFFTDTLTGYAVGSYGVLVSTTDGGVTWAVDTITAGESLRDVYFSGRSHGWAVGQDVILRTTDSGHTWTPAATWPVTTLYAIEFPDLSHG